MKKALVSIEKTARRGEILLIGSLQRAPLPRNTADGVSAMILRSERSDAAATWSRSR